MRLVGFFSGQWTDLSHAIAMAFGWFQFFWPLFIYLFFMKCLTFIEMAIRWQGQLAALKLQIGFCYFNIFRLMSVQVVEMMTGRFGSGSGCHGGACW